MSDKLLEDAARAFLKAGPDEMAFVGDHRGDDLERMTIDGEVNMIAGMRAAFAVFLTWRSSDGAAPISKRDESGLPKREDCNCNCHTTPGVMHFGPCCL